MYEAFHPNFIIFAIGLRNLFPKHIRKERSVMLVKYLET